MKCFRSNLQDKDLYFVENYYEMVQEGLMNSEMRKQLIEWMILVDL
jgi:hypothetical protein